MSIYEIEQAIQQLSHQDLEMFRRWFGAFDAQAWDEQIDTDAKSGKLEKIAREARRLMAEGKAEPMNFSKL
jgi:hypothetical protein